MAFQASETAGSNHDNFIVDDDLFCMFPYWLCLRSHNPTKNHMFMSEQQRPAVLASANGGNGKYP
jgi:hypothetical protein